LFKGSCSVIRSSFLSHWFRNSYFVKAYKRHSPLTNTKQFANYEEDHCLRHTNYEIRILDSVIQKYTPQIVTPSQILVAIPVNNLAPGKTNHYWWNNATPSVAVWYIQAVPLEKSFSNTTVNQSVEVEITRVWRKLNQSYKSSGEFPQSYYEHEVHYEVKNIGTLEVDFDVYASIISE